MKKFLSLILVFTLIAGFAPFVDTVSASGENLLYRFSPANKDDYTTYDKSGETVLEGKNLVTSSDTYISTLINFNTPIPVKDIGMKIKFKIMVEGEENIKYVAVRIYGNHGTDNYQSKNLVKDITGGKWYEDEFILWDAQNRIGTAPLTENDFITKLRIDIPNDSGVPLKFHTEYYEFYEPDSGSLEQVGQKEIDEISEKIKNALPGDTIEIPNGVYTNVKFKIDGQGTKDAPVIVTAKTPGEVVFKGHSRMTIGGTGVTVKGLLFDGGFAHKVITFAPYSEYLRLTETAIVNWNPPKREDYLKWVQIYGKNNRMDHCFFRGKNSQGQVAEIVRSISEDQNILIDHNYFGKFPIGIKNGCESLRFCNTTDVNANCKSTALCNFFDDASGEGEVISNKSNDNKYINNTFHGCIGGLSLRIGKRNEAKGNLFIGDGRDTSKVTGISIVDEDNKVNNNYFLNLPPSSCAIAMTNGTDPNPASYELVKNADISNNTIINCGKGISIGTYSYMLNATYPRIYPPEGEVYNNFCYTTYPTYDGFALDDKKAKKVKYKNNIVTGNSSMPKKSGITKKDVEIKESERGLYFPTEKIGADFEIVKNAPISPMEIIPQWIKDKISAGDKRFEVRIPNLKPITDDDIVLMGVSNNKAYNYLSGVTKIDENTNVSPKVIDGRTVVPVRFISETFGFDVVWFSDTQKVKLKKNNGYNYVEFQIGTKIMNKNGTEKEIDSEAVIMDGRTYVPLRAAVEAISKNVHWDDRGYIIVTANENIKPNKEYFDKYIPLIQ